jgi:sulfide:quinone oxidoreductase
VPMKVVIAGGGVAALEAALALRVLASDRVDVELVAPEPLFWYRPLSVAEPFGGSSTPHYDLAQLAAAAGATFSLGSVARVHADRHVVVTAAGAELAYDALLLAVGTVPKAGIEGALTFRGPADVDALRALLDGVHADGQRVAFAVPWGAAWALPLYELALMSAAALAARGSAAEVCVVTPEEEPLQLFGREASDAMRGLLAERHVALYTSAYPVGHTGGWLRVVPHANVAADRVVALPRLVGPAIAGVPRTSDGFVPVDAHGRVVGAPDVYAAGDVTAFPVKQGGLAAQQADAAAEAIAEAAGADIEPAPFRPVVRGLLLTGTTPRYLRRELGRAGEPWLVSDEPLWWPPAKIVGRHFAPFFAELASLSVGEPPAGVAVDVDLDAGDERGDPFTVERLHAVLEPDADEAETVTVGRLMTREPILVASEDTLGHAAEQLRERDAGSALVVDGGSLVGILTARDLVRAYAARVSPSAGRVREWMTVRPVTVRPETTADVAALLMAEEGFDHLPVTEGERVVGSVGLRAVAPHTALATARAPIGLGL